jgi:hypothetical protein
MEDNEFLGRKRLYRNLEVLLAMGASQDTINGRRETLIPH